MPDSFTIAAVGDVIFTRPPSQRFARDLLQGANLVTGNLEGPITPSHAAADKLIPLKMPPEAATWIRDEGFDVLSLANNHAMDFGPEGLTDTLAAMRDVDVAIVGAGPDLDASLAVYTTVRDGVRVAVVGLASTVPTGFAAGPNRPGIAPVRIHVSFAIDGALNEEQPGTPPYVHTRVDDEDASRALDVIRNAARDADVVVVHIHWGVPPEWRSPFQGSLAEYQRPLGHALIDAGATLVIGHHAHSLQGAEAYGDGLILYSLGNFAFHPYADRTEFRLARPAPPFKTRHTELNFQSVGAHVHFAREADRWTFASCRLTPARLNDGAEAERVDDAHASAILDVIEHSDANAHVRYERTEGSTLLRADLPNRGSNDV